MHLSCLPRQAGGRGSQLTDVVSDAAKPDPGTVEVEESI